MEYRCEFEARIRVIDKEKVARLEEVFKELGIDAKFVTFHEMIPYPPIPWGKPLNDRITAILKAAIDWWAVPQPKNALGASNLYIREENQPGNLGITSTIGWQGYPIFVFTKPYGNKPWTEIEVQDILQMCENAGGHYVHHWNGVGLRNLSVALDNDCEGLEVLNHNAYVSWNKDEKALGMDRDVAVKPPAPWN